MSLNSTPCGEMPAWFRRLIDSLISRFGGHAGASDDEYGAGMCADDQRVGHRQDRRRVEQHQVVVGADRLEQPAEIQVQQEFGTVRRQRAGRDEVEVFQHAVMDRLRRRGIAAA